jgi:asparagine synthase (glutamine-hydrolysing)
MSGILGMWNSPQPAPWQSMLEDLQVLGQDGQGDWHDADVGLSLGRTQFFNTPESRLEPPVVQAEGCVLVWDGRLDDREPLLMGRSQVTDAQLIIEAYRRWGVECLDRLIGDFAFILWDAVQGRLIAGCDAMGQTVIAYYWDGRTLLLSSRVLTLSLHPQVSPQLDDVYVAHTIGNTWKHPAGMTALKDVQRLRPGHALVLQAGRLTDRAIAQLRSPAVYPSAASPEAYYDEFWHLLNQAVKDRLRNPRPAYMPLSGGLDSTTVTIALLNHLPTVDAFSMGSDIYPEFDESQAIQSFLKAYPQVNWHPINCDDAWALTEPWDDLPVPDDPFITCVLPANLRTLALAQQKGFGVEFSGVWGDELCYTLLQDQVRGGNWGLLWQELKPKKYWHSFLYRQLILPELPQTWQDKWIASRYRPSQEWLPAWLTPAYAQSSRMQTVAHQCLQASLTNNRARVIDKLLEGASYVGSTQLFKLLACTYRIESVSPMGDRRLMEFAHRIPPKLQIDATYQKNFLRQANRATLPDDVRLRPKLNYFDPLKYAGIGEGDIPLQLLEQAKNEAFLQEIIDFAEFEQQLKDYRCAYTNSYSPGNDFETRLDNEFLSAFTFFNWLLNLKKHYSVSL